MVPSFRVLFPRLIVAGVLPVVGYALLRPHVSSDAVALTAVLVFPLAEVVLERVKSRRFEPIGIIVMLGILTGLLGAVAFGGNATLLKVRESLVTGVFGAVCLASLLRTKPVMFYLGRAFSTGGDAAAVAEFDTIWDLPGVPARFRLTTAVWGVVLVAEAVGRTVLALTMSTGPFLVTAQVINWTVLGALLWWTLVYSRASEERVLASLS